MKLKKKILVIDDKDQEIVLNSIKQTLKNDFDVTTIGIKTTKLELRSNASNRLDVDKLKLEISKLYEEHSHFDLILTDFDLNENYIDGLDVVDYIKSIRLNAKIMMYSANFTKAVQKVVRSTDEKLNEQQVADAVSKLIDYNIIKYIDRNSYKDEVEKFLRGDKKVSIRDEFLKLLYNHKELVFNSCYPDFKGKNFGEIADIIENHKDARSEKWMQALIQQTVAYLVKINEL